MGTEVLRPLTRILHQAGEDTPRPFNSYGVACEPVSLCAVRAPTAPSLWGRVNCVTTASSHIITGARRSALGCTHKHDFRQK